MNNLEIKLHTYQSTILKKLVITPQLRFNELLVPGLTSEHMNYHLKKLLGYDFVTKDGDFYTLTDNGKDYTNLLNEEITILEKQPKTSIIIRGTRKNPETGEVEHLLNRRLRQPYYGKVGRITGKPIFGETLQQAAARELYEETGLTAKNFELEQIYHKLRNRPDGTWVQDVLFYIFFVSDFAGELIAKTAFQENFWAGRDEIESNPDKYDMFDDIDLEDRLQPAALSFVESVGEAVGF